ncbi:PD-(D/E)XK nuclease family protein [Planctomycetota bacterium]
MQQVFLDWTQPALPSATKFLFQRAKSQGVVDLSQTIVVVPGGRAGRRLGELLLRKSNALGQGYLPPNITTVGGLPEMLYQPRFPFASKIVQQLAWTRVLRETSRKDLKQLVKDPPTRADDSRWVELAGMLQQQHRELAGDGFDFSDVLRVGKDIETFEESERWEVLADIQRRYLAFLDGLKIWDRQTARLKAIEFEECKTNRDIVLVATADMNRVMRRMLDQVADRVTSLVFAPETLKSRFDSHGCLNVGAWQGARLDIRDDSIVLANNATEQAESVVDAIASFDGQFAANEITVGIPDESIIPHVESVMRQSELNARWGPGSSLEKSRPIRFLRSVVDYLNERNFENLAELLRNPDVARWLRGKHVDPNELLSRLDRFQQKHLPNSADKFTAQLDRNATPTVAAKLISDLLKPLNGKDRTPGDWSTEIVSVLKTLIGAAKLDLEDPVQRTTLVAVDAIRDGLQQLETIPESLSELVPASHAILMTLAQVRSLTSSKPAEPDSIELLGWLELPLDDAPAKIITSFNEGFVPSSIDSDLFLPDVLRSKLGIDDSHRLYARDIYAASAIAASSRELRIVVSRHRGDGEPSLPSRLLFASGDEKVLQRSLRFFADDSIEQEPSVRFDNLAERHAFFIPKPLSGEHQIEKLSVTAFRSFLACPYRFYLQHVLQLDDASDAHSELDPRSFGTLMHAVLEDFGSGPEKDSQSPEVIAKFLDHALNERAKSLFGRRARPAVRVQVEQMRTRLHAFADRQAKRRDDGWRIHLTEEETKDVKTKFATDRNAIDLVGRIDRIDRHEESGKYAVLDYKSSESGLTPKQTHLKRGEWIDLQLPLYRHLVQPLGLREPVELGYILLPNETSKVDFSIADWDAAELSAADSVAARVVDAICDEIFWPPTRPAPPFSEVYSAICQDTVFDRGDAIDMRKGWTTGHGAGDPSAASNQETSS